MHPNPTYRQQTHAQALDAANDRGFGFIAAYFEGLSGAHVPFFVEDQRVFLHLNRANPLARAATKQAIPAMLVVSLCDAYVSPAWYHMDDQVPTWLYGAVHINGFLEVLPDKELEPLLVQLSAKFESRLAPAAPWTMDKLSKQAKDKLMRAIQPFSLRITAIDATDKFAQTKPAQALASLAPKLEDHSFGSNVDRVAQRVRHHHRLKTQ